MVRITLETAYAAGLLARDGDHVAATEGYDTWAEREPAERLAVLLQAWWKLPLTPAQARDEDGKALPALAGTPPCDGCVRACHGLLTADAWVPAGQGLKSTRDLGPLVAWCRPLADQLPQDETPFVTVIREAELLGVLARGVLSPIGAALSADDTEGPASVCRRLLPAATGTARIGADLTAVVTGTPSARLTALLDSVADREAGGTASVWRFSAGGIRRAPDAGHASQLSLTDVRPLPRPRRHARIARESERDGTRTSPPAAEKQEPDMVSDGRPPRTPSQLWDSVRTAVRCAVIRWRRGLPTSRVGAVRAATSGCRG
ncbi:hypothetical protein ABT150_39730 [Streptomyces mirabilis]|uniref:hypothetical protein n=1 Tax=Streptomyces mirabilis TaxID=68239 RepID=UPI003330D321